jgi:hypothetical protein
MNPVMLLAFAQAALNVLPTLLMLGADVKAFITQTNAVLASGKDPTQADWDAINATISQELTALRARVMVVAPMNQADAPVA